MKTLTHTRALHSLGAVARLWLDPSDPLRLEALQALQVSTGFSARMIEDALHAAFQELTEEKMAAACVNDPGLSKPRRVLHILAGNVFTAWLPGAVITLLLDGECWLKPPTQEPVFAPLWKRSVTRVDRELGEKIQVVSWRDDLLKRVDAVVAYGSDETLAALRKKMPPLARFIGYGHKISAAVVFQEALTPGCLQDTLDQAARDIEPFALQGCLSPQRVFVEGGDLAPWRSLAASMPAMPELKPFRDWADVARGLEAGVPHWSCLGYAGPSERIEPLRPQLASLGFTRICPLGEMQQPPLTWRNGGLSLVQELGRSGATAP